MGLGGVAIVILPSIMCLKLTFSDGLGGGSVETRVQILVYGRIASRISIFLLHLACGVDGCVGSATTNINTEWRLLLILQTMATAIVSIHYESELIFRP